MKKTFIRFNAGLIIAKALYSGREEHLRDLRTLKNGVEGQPLAASEKVEVAKRIVIRVGKDTAALWVPPTLLWLATKAHKDEK